MAVHMSRTSVSAILRLAVQRTQPVRHIFSLTQRSLPWICTNVHRLPAFTESTLKTSNVVQVRFLSGGPTLTASDVEENVLKVLKQFDAVDSEKVSLDAHFIDDMGLDSLDVVEIMMAFEDEFGVEISDEQAEKIFTPRASIELIKASLGI